MTIAESRWSVLPHWASGLNAAWGKGEELSAGLSAAPRGGRGGRGRKRQGGTMVGRGKVSYRSHDYIIIILWRRLQFIIILRAEWDTKRLS